MSATEHTFCTVCDQLIPSGHLRRGGAIYALGSWYCKQCCMDGTASGVFLTVEEVSPPAGDLAPELSAPDPPELDELRIRQELLLSEIDRLKGEAQEWAGGGADRDQRAREPEAELAPEGGSAAALQQELSGLRRDLARADETLAETAEVRAERDQLAARVVELDQALEELRAQQPEGGEREDPAAGLALEEARAEVQHLGAALRDAQRSEAQLHARVHELLQGGGILPPPATEPPASPGEPDPSSPSVRMSDMSRARSTSTSKRRSVRSMPLSDRVVRALEYIGSTDFFRTPLTWVYFGLGVASILLPLYIGYDLFKGRTLGVGLMDIPGKQAFVIGLEWVVLLLAGWISFELWRTRVRDLPGTADEADQFCATPLAAHLMRTVGEWLGLWIAVVGFLNGIIVELAVVTTLVERPEAGILMRRMGIPGLGVAMVFAFPILGYLIIFVTRTAAEALSALTAIANNTRRD